MFLLHTVIAVWACAFFLNIILSVEGLHKYDPSHKLKKEKEDELDDIQQKTPLIDVIFTDGTSRTCTGAIIHEFVVITAGHCFIPLQKRAQQREVVAELTGSFVVIGTKKKFDSGYEEYLPIERVITHPNMRGWSCDLALVHTFASLSVDGVAAIMPLAGEKTSTSLEPNVTILSWGRVVEMPQDGVFETENNCCTADKSCDSEEPKCAHNNNEPKDDTESQTRGEDKVSTILYGRGKEHNRYDNRFALRKGPERTTSPGSRYLSSGEMSKKSDSKLYTRPAEAHMRHQVPDEDENSEPTKYRRFVYEGQQPQGENKLTLETFGFLNAPTCKKMLVRAQPDMEIHDEEIVCYASDDHYVTEEDSGAPVVRQGQLIAITVGGIKSDGDHVAVGMKLSYFCPWINENLPGGDTSLHCWAQLQNTAANESITNSESYKRIRIH